MINTILLYYLLGFLIIYIYKVFLFFPYIHKSLQKYALETANPELLEFSTGNYIHITDCIITLFLWWFMLFSMLLLGIKIYSKTYTRGVINAYSE